MNDAENLRAARELIARPNGWTTKAYNRSDSGMAWVDREDAVCWCAEGAIIHVLGLEINDNYNDDFYRLSRLLSDAMGVFAVVAFNDEPGRTQPEVVAAFDRAIALAESAP